MTRLELALDRILFTREYSLRTLNTIPQDLWFRFPSNCPTHIAWQIGHIAIAQYRLGLERTRGKRPQDEEILPGIYLKLFGKGSTPVDDPGHYPPAEEIIEVFHKVHQQVIRELPQIPDADLDLAPVVEHPLIKTRLGCLFMASEHEMIHGGQIGLLRRLLGLNPYW